MPDRSRLVGPLTALQVENEILRLMYLLEDRTDELAHLAMSAARAEANHKKKWALHFTAATGTEKTKTAMADLDSADEFITRKLAEAIHSSCRESIFSIRTQIDSLRTINASIRAQT